MIICDGHVHIYPFYNISVFFESAFRNLSSLADDYVGNYADDAPLKLCLLAERSDCHAFSDILNRRFVLPDGFSLESDSSEEALAISRSGEEKIYFIPGRQIATKERLELISLGSDREIPDGVYFKEGISLAREYDSLAILNWAPGKWLFSRERIVENILDNYSQGELLISDTALRPRCWSEPRLLKSAREKGFAVIAGSDPLPLNAEEQRVGTYGFALKTAVDSGSPLALLKTALSSANKPEFIGKRLGAFGVSRRLLELRSRRKA